MNHSMLHFGIVPRFCISAKDAPGETYTRIFRHKPSQGSSLRNAGMGAYTEFFPYTCELSVKRLQLNKADTNLSRSFTL
jgi:hypothetical protein